MRKVGWIKLKIFLIIFLIGSLFFILLIFNVKISKSQAFIDSGFLESPVFDLGTEVNVKKFLWKGYVDQDSHIEFILFGGSNPNNLNQFRTFTIPPYQIYRENEDLLKKIRYLKYRINFYKYTEDSIPRVDQIFIYYSK